MKQETYNILLALLDRPIAYHPIFGKVGGGLGPGVFLSQLWYWTPKTKDGEGWIYKTGEEWTQETQMSRSEQETSRRRLKERGLIEEKISGLPAKLYYRVNLSSLWEAINQVAGNLQASLPETSTPGCDIPASSIRNTETTTKTTTENTGLLWIAVSEACGYPRIATKDQSRRINSIMPSLLKAGVTSQEVSEWFDTLWKMKDRPWPSQVLEGVMELRSREEEVKQDTERRIENREKLAREQLKRRKQASKEAVSAG